MSFKTEVVTGSSSKWHGNVLRFATKAEAHDAATDLTRRWTLVRAYRVVESDDPVNCRMAGGRAELIKQVEP